ncbi:MAG: tetratricopeptide repeat protein [bacterium]
METKDFEEEIDRLSTLLNNTETGALVFCLYSTVGLRDSIVKRLKEKLKIPIEELSITKKEKNPLKLIQSLGPIQRSTICFYSIEDGFPEALGYINYLREPLFRYDHGLLFWITDYSRNEIATKAPDLWSRRSGVFDFRLYLEPKMEILEHSPPTLEDALRRIGKFMGRRVVLLTDMKGSSELFSKQGDLTAVLVQKQREILMEEIKGFRGEAWAVGGDGMLAFFESPEDALKAIIKIQTRLKEEGFSVRAGGHTGDVFLDPNMQCQTINITARIMGLADGGQILISEILYEEAKNKGFSFCSHSNYPLKGIPEPIEVYEVLWDKDQKPKPPLQTISKERVKHNLPRPSPIFIGRKKDMELLQKKKSRLLTITGGAGIGKTTLALHLCWWHLSEEKFNQIALVDLQWARNVSQLFEYLGRILGIERFELNLKDIPEDRLNKEEFIQKERQIISKLTKGKSLLFLDNFETVTGEEATSLLVSILEKVGETRFIITSRRPVWVINWEEVYELLPLPLEKAVELFTKHSHRRISEEDKGVATEICETIHCLPLSIELVAQHTSQMSLREIKDGLRKSRLSLQKAELTGVRGFKDMAASLEFTYTRLKADEKRLFLTLSVFEGNFDRKAVEGISGMDEWSGLLGSLISWHLLQYREEKGLSRYFLLETIKEYDRLKLENEGSSLRLSIEELAFRHSQYYLKVAQGSSNPWPEIEKDEPNIRKAADWVAEKIEKGGSEKIERGDSEKIERGDRDREKIEKGGSEKIERGDRDREKIEKGGRDRGIIDLAYGYAFALKDYIYRRSIKEGLRWLLAGVVACQKLRKKQDEANLYNSIGLRDDSQGNYQEALAWYEKGIKIFEEIGDQAGLATTYNNIGVIHKAQGNYQEALAWYEKSRKINERIGNQAVLATTYNNIGMIHDAQGNYQEALAWYEKRR